ncbi:MAG TPA: folylpolyglutamate synthase/dihydrofolate synthase family protein [Bacteroidales bacterium]|nr:folylpolyglutamate synthase/dihydrofolate synthase family protein [Bacteroidales bacterium]
MTYEETIEFLYGQLPAYHRVGKAAYKDDLGNTVILDDHLGRPHKKYMKIHVAGTNGKGSVSHMIASVLQEAGYRTGLYTSPHIRDFRERIRINGKMIAEQDVIDFVQDNMSILEEVHPSFFEMTVAMALNYFAVNRVDVAIIEVGLGGRLDSTNIIDPVLSVITNIGHDHMDLLGDTLEKVAGEKAGIIKRGRPVVISESQPESENVFKARAAEKDSAIFFADRMFSCRLDNSYGLNPERKYEIIETATGRITQGVTSLTGDYQAANLKAVFASFAVLRDFFKLGKNHLLKGVRNVVVNTGLEGRWQVVAHNPLVICDTGHNPEGLKYVINQLASLNKDKLHVVAGFVSDKDTDSVLPLFPADAIYYFTKASVPRAMDELILMKAGAAYGLRGKAYSNVGSALSAALNNAGVNDVIFVGGSTFVVADIL